MANDNQEYDNRQKIIEGWQIDSASDQRDRENMRRLIGLQAQRIAALEAANAELREQRDSWKAAAEALGEKRVSDGT